MKLSVTSWSLPQCNLSEAIGLTKVLGIDAIDVGYFYRSALDRARIITAPEDAAERLNNYDSVIPCLYHLFGADTADRNLALQDVDEQNLRQLEQVTVFCEKAGIETLFLLPGIVNPGQSLQTAMDHSARNLKKMLEVCQRKGIALAIEPHVHSFLESPDLVLELLDKVPGLKLVLDYAHFVCMGFTQNAVDPLIPYAALVHLRQAKPGYLQTSLEGGVINFNRLLGKLDEQDFSGYLSIEYVHQGYMDTLYTDVLSETIKMRDLVRAWRQTRTKRSNNS